MLSRYLCFSLISAALIHHGCASRHRRSPRLIVLLAGVLLAGIAITMIKLVHPLLWLVHRRIILGFMHAIVLVPIVLILVRVLLVIIDRRSAEAAENPFRSIARTIYRDIWLVERCTRPLFYLDSLSHLDDTYEGYSEESHRKLGQIGIKI